MSARAWAKRIFGLSITLWLAVGRIAAAAAQDVQVAYAPTQPALAAPGPGRAALFGTQETHSPDIAPFYKWTDLLNRFRAQTAAAAGPCPAGVAAGCAPQPWLALVAALGPLDLRAKVERVNAEINRYPYIPSQLNWGIANYWETPFEFFRKSGQCQDYAVAKFMALRAAGVPNELVRLVVVRDTAHAIDHAVVVVFVDGDALMLDNQLRAVVPTAQVHAYEPYYSINETGWWLHSPGPGVRLAAGAKM